MTPAALHRAAEATSAGLLTRIASGSSAEMVDRLLSTLLPDAATVLDMTWGRGRFWGGSGRRVVGVDISPHGQPSVVADFTRLPFGDGAFDVCVFDPPYNADAGQKSVIGGHFGTYRTTVALRAAVEAGAREAWRVATARG